MEMSSLIAENSNEGESILPEVAELSEFHPDQLTSLVDIQEELEKLEADEAISREEIKLEESIPMVDSEIVVDHEVTIMADQPSEEITILPEISEIVQGNVGLDDKGSVEDSFNSIFEESLGLTDIIPHNSSNLKESNPILHEKKSSNLETIVQPSKFQVKMIKPYPDVNRGQGTVVPSKKSVPVMTKVIYKPTNQKTDESVLLKESGTPAVRVLNQNRVLTNNTPSKGITLAQAKEMGKIQILPNQNVGVQKKVAKPTKTVTMMKSPVKILPLPTTSQLQMITPTSAINSSSTIVPKYVIRQHPMKGSAIITGPSSSSERQILQIPVSQSSLSKQIHQIQLPGKQVQYVRLVSAVHSKNGQVARRLELRDVSGLKSEAIKTNTIQTITRPVPVALSTATSNAPHIKMVNITPSQTISASTLQNANTFEKVTVSPGLSQLTSKPDVKTTTNNIVMVPAEFVKQFKPLSPNITKSPPSPTKPAVSTALPVAAAIPPPTLLSQNKEVVPSLKETPATNPTIFPVVSHKPKAPAESNGLKTKKPCNCTKSQCLKLYCDCFANGEFCFQCNCNCCYNNLDHEEERSRAIRACLERNPNAFRPKIGKGYVGDERRHNKGCNCKRSGCLKNYCECYEAKIPCSGNCKCVGCRNIEEVRDVHGKTSIDGSKKLQPIAMKSKLPFDLQRSFFKPNTLMLSQGNKQPSNLMTHEVVEATCQCLVAQVEGSQQLTDEVEKFILEEFGRCLVEIIECTTRTNVNTT